MEKSEASIHVEQLGQGPLVPAWESGTTSDALQALHTKRIEGADFPGTGIGEAGITDLY